MGRLTNNDVMAALTRYHHALTFHGFQVPAPGEPGGPCLSEPYGHVHYVVRYDGHRPCHDLPGFVGSGGSGFVTRREAVAALNAAASTLYDLGQWQQLGAAAWAEGGLR